MDPFSILTVTWCWFIGCKASAVEVSLSIDFALKIQIYPIHTVPFWLCNTKKKRKVKMRTLHSPYLFLEPRSGRWWKKFCSSVVSSWDACAFVHRFHRHSHFRFRYFRWNFLLQWKEQKINFKVIFLSHLTHSTPCLGSEDSKRALSWWLFN